MGLSFKVIIIFILISIINILSTTHMFPVMLMGINFYLFSKLLDESKYYGVLISIVVFAIFEINHGFPLLSISLLSFILYSIVVPYFMTNVSILNRSKVASISIFYLSLFILLAFVYEMSFILFMQLILNFLFDIFIGFVIL